MKKVLVTGGAGFFGTSLTKGLINSGYFVKALDIDKSREVIDNTGALEFVLGDIRDKNLLNKSCKDLDFLIHAAAILPISRSKKKIFWDVNVNGTRNVLESALNNNVKRVIFISSSSQYGIPKEVPITEKTEFNPVCDYGKSKLAAENVCCEFRKKGLDVVILRPRTIIGTGRLGLFQILYSWIADNKKIYIIGKGDNLFSFLSESDLVNACILALKKDCKNQDFNLGTKDFKTVKDDLTDLINHVKSSSRIISTPAKPVKLLLRILDKLNLAPFTQWHYMTPDKPFYFDISKAIEILDWNPELSNIEMLKDNYSYYLNNRQKIDSNFGTTHSNSVKQKILKFLKKIS